MSFRDDLLPDIDAIRSIPGDLGLHRFQVWVRKIEWTGSRTGLGTSTTTDTRLLVGGKDPHVKELRMHDVIAGDSAKSFVHYEIGPVTTEFVGGGYSPDNLSPPQTGTPTELYYLVKGPGLPDAGILCQRVDDDTDKPFRYVIRVKSTGR